MGKTDPETLREWRKYARIRLGKIVDERLIKGCMDCGETHLAVLQFHHREGEPYDKRYRSVRRMVTHCRPQDAIIKELAKCDVLCANCHLKRHYDAKSGFFAQIREKSDD